MEKRKLPRMLFSADVRIIYNGSTIDGIVENISMSGMYVRTSDIIDVNSHVDIILNLGENKKLTIKLEGIINRLDGNGFAIEFNDIEINKKLAQAFS